MAQSVINNSILGLLTCKFEVIEGGNMNFLLESKPLMEFREIISRNAPSKTS